MQAETMCGLKITLDCSCSTVGTSFIIVAESTKVTWTLVMQGDVRDELTLDNFGFLQGMNSLKIHVVINAMHLLICYCLWGLSQKFVQNTYSL